MTGVDVPAIRAALAKATPGPWRADNEHGLMPGSKPAWVVSQTDVGEQYLGDLAYIPQDRGVAEDQSGPCEQADAELIVLLRNNAEALLDELSYAQLANERLREQLGEPQRRHLAAGGPMLSEPARVAINEGERIIDAENRVYQHTKVNGGYRWVYVGTAWDAFVDGSQPTAR